jgi:hypothetical protein
MVRWVRDAYVCKEIGSSFVPDAGATVEERPFQGRVASPQTSRALAPVGVFSQSGNIFFDLLTDITLHFLFKALRFDHG